MLHAGDRRAQSLTKKHHGALTLATAESPQHPKSGRTKKSSWGVKVLKSLAHKIRSPWRSCKWECLERAGVTEERDPAPQTMPEVDREESYGLSLPSALWSLARTSRCQLSWEPGARKWFPVTHSEQRQGPAMTSLSLTSHLQSLSVTFCVQNAPWQPHDFEHLVPTGTVLEGCEPSEGGT